MQVISGLIRLMRLGNGLIAGLAVMLGALLGQPTSPDWLWIGIAGTSALLITAGGNTLNDVCDREIDRLNRPERPLPAGMVSVRQATIWGSLLLLAGLGISYRLQITLFGMAMLVTVLILIYNLRWKRQPLIGNVVVALSSALCFVYGGLAVNTVLPTLIPAVFAFFFHLAREIIKDIEDMRGDRAQRATTFPIVYGEEHAIRLVIFILWILVILIPLPYLLGIYSWVYLLIVTIGVLPVLAHTIMKLKNRTQPANFAQISLYLKLDMIVGILAIWKGQYP